MKIPNDTNTFNFFNANPKNKRTSDCVVRALSAATGVTWDEVLNELFTIALKEKIALDDAATYGRYLKAHGWKKEKQPRKNDNTKFTGAEWCVWLSVNRGDGDAGRIFAHIGGHHAVCIAPTNEGDGINCRYKVLDTWDSTRGCIGNYWIKE